MSDDVMTGEAVALDVRIAQLPTRCLSLFVDLLVQLVVATIAIIALGLLSDGLTESLQTAAILLTVIFIVVLLPTGWETLSHGRSPGKAATGLRVVRTDGGPVRLRHCLIRSFTMFFDLWVLLGVPGLVMTLFTPRAQRLGDVLAGTIVVRERVPRAASPAMYALSMPPPLASWAASANLSAIPDSLLMSARTFLARAPRLDATSRSVWGPQLAADISVYVSPSSPPGTPAEAYLQAVLAERTRRALSSAQPPGSAPVYASPTAYAAMPTMPPPTVAPPSTQTPGQVVATDTTGGPGEVAPPPPAFRAPS